MRSKKEKVKHTIHPDEQINVSDGKISYGDMVTLGRILDAESARAEKGEGDEVETIKALIRTLHPGAQPSINATNAVYAAAIARGVRFWREQENLKLKYKPSDEEKQAGYEALAEVTGPTGVAITIAEKFGVAAGPGNKVGPDAVFDWPYAVVFKVLHTDLERSKFQKRLNEIYEKKRKRNERNHRR